jgi:tetratricopeptide (TPR) repeat protein
MTLRRPSIRRVTGYDAVAARAVLVALVAALLVTALAAPAGASTKCTPEQGQAFIDEGRYEQAIREFTCVVDAAPTEVEGYRGRSEAELLLGRYSDALREYARITALVEPVHPDARKTILAGYANRLATSPDDIRALTGASFARWTSFDYAQAIHLLNHLLEVRPDDVYGNLFRGSSRLLHGATRELGVADLERAIALAPASPDVRFIVADAYTYGLPDPERAFAEASLALDWGLDTARVQAILATAYDAFGDPAAAASHIHRSIELVTSELLTTSPLATGGSLALDLVPGRTYEIPVAVSAGEKISITTSSKDFYDSIAVLLAPDGTPVVGSDDANAYFAAFDWVAPKSGTYRLQVTSFESVNTGVLVVKRA